MGVSIMKDKQVSKSSDKVNIRIQLQRDIWNKFRGQCIYHSLDWKKEVWTAIEKHLEHLKTSKAGTKKTLPRKGESRQTSEKSL